MHNVNTGEEIEPYSNLFKLTNQKLRARYGEAKLLYIGTLFYPSGNLPRIDNHQPNRPKHSTRRLPTWTDARRCRDDSAAYAVQTGNHLEL
jgi:hypothetical protein